MILFPFILFLSLLLLLLLSSTLWVELIIKNTTAVQVRIGICWWQSRYRLSVPLYRSRPLQSQSSGAAKKATENRLSAKSGQLILMFLSSILPYSRISISGQMTVGTGDAAETGFLVGIIWQLIGLFNTFAPMVLKAGTTKLKIEPAFRTACLNVNISCILFLPVLHIITASAQTIKHLSKSNFEQGGRKLWQSIPFKG